jgi:hypothetical protein
MNFLKIKSFFECFNHQKVREKNINRKSDYLYLVQLSSQKNIPKFG